MVMRVGTLTVALVRASSMEHIHGFQAAQDLTTPEGEEEEQTEEDAEVDSGSGEDLVLVSLLQRMEGTIMQLLCVIGDHAFAPGCLLCGMMHAGVVP